MNYSNDNQIQEDTKQENTKQEYKIKDFGRSTFNILSSYFNIINTTIGGGILSLPITFFMIGFIPATILLIIIGLITYYTYYCLIIPASDIKEKDDINNINVSMINVSTYFSYILQIMIIMYCIGACTVYINILGNGLHTYIKLLTKSDIYSNTFFITAILLIFIILPMCLSRNIKWLAIPSSACLFCILYVFIVLLIRMFEKFSKNEIIFDKFRLFNFDNPFNFFRALPIILFSFVSQFNAIATYREFDNRTPTKMLIVTLFSKLTCFILYFLYGFIGYLMFSQVQNMEANILNNFPNNDYLILSAKIAVFVVLIVSFPINMYGATETTLKLIKILRKDENDVLIKSDSYYLYLILTLIFSFISYIFGNAIQDLIRLINLCVTFSGGFGCFVFPIIIYFYHIKNESNKFVYYFKKMFAFFIGSLMALLSTISLIIGIIETIKYFKGE